MAPSQRGDAVAVVRGPRAASDAPSASLSGYGERFDPHWWLRRGAGRNQRERRRDLRRRGGR